MSVGIEFTSTPVKETKTFMPPFKLSIFQWALQEERGSTAEFSAAPQKQQRHQNNHQNTYKTQNLIFFCFEV